MAMPFFVFKTLTGFAFYTKVRNGYTISYLENPY